MILFIVIYMAYLVEVFVEHFFNDLFGVSIEPISVSIVHQTIIVHSEYFMEPQSVK